MKIKKFVVHCLTFPLQLSTWLIWYFLFSKKMRKEFLLEAMQRPEHGMDAYRDSVKKEFSNKDDETARGGGV